MTVPHRWERIQELFDAALELAPEARTAYVHERAEDSTLRTEVLALLEAHEARGRLDSIADRLDASSTVAAVRFPPVLSGRYSIEREIGRGGMATVYLAHDQKHDRQVALKVLRSELALAVRAEQFVREIAIAAKLAHPHILPLHDSGEAEGIVYYVMPYVEGESLRDRLTREGRLPFADAVRIAGDVAAALSYAHSHGVVHRDIKPENILLAPGGEALIADFGIARALTVAGGHPLSQTGAVGTPLYMSPEQAAGSGLDGRSDIYSLGCVLHEMLAGHPPFTGATAQEVIARHASDPIPALEAARPGVGARVARAVRKALAKQPVDRFATAGQFASALEGTGDDRPTRDRRRATALAVGLTCAGLVVAGGYWLAGRGGASTERSPVTPRVAVMPFVNHGPAEDQYFVDGIAEEITAKLAGLHGLTAITPSSAQYRDGNKSLQQIARELGAQYLLQRVERRGIGAHGLSRAVQRAGDRGPFARDERPRAGVEPQRFGGTDLRRCAASQLIQLAAERLCFGRIGVGPVGGRANEDLEVVDGANRDLAGSGVPAAALLADGPGQGLEPRRRPRDRLPARHQRGAAQRPRQPHELLGGRARSLGSLQHGVQALEILPRLEGEEVGHAERGRGAWRSRGGRRAGHGEPKIRRQPSAVSHQ